MKFETPIQTTKLRSRMVDSPITNSSYQSNKMSIAIVTDSTADIPSPLATKYNITVIPAVLIVDGKSLEDGKGISREELYQILPSLKTPPTTATPSVGAFRNVYDNLLQKGFGSILSIHVSSLLSGIYNAAQTAAQEFKHQVTVVDSQQLSLGLGYQVLAAAESAAQGVSMESIIRGINQVRKRVRLVAMLDTLEHVHRSGRVSWIRASLGSLMNIKPLLEIKDGHVLSLGQVRTRIKGMNALIDHFNRTGTIEKYAILHTNSEKDARKLITSLPHSISDPPLIVNVTTVVGTHVGPNALGFVAVRK
jgi:DegV family protein with EDD domain